MPQLMLFLLTHVFYFNVIVDIMYGRGKVVSARNYYIASFKQ